MTQRKRATRLADTFADMLRDIESPEQLKAIGAMVGSMRRSWDQRMRSEGGSPGAHAMCCQHLDVMRKHAEGV